MRITAGLAVALTAATGILRGGEPTIPRTWDEEALRAFEMPLADRSVTRTYMSAQEYYALPIRPVYKSYPIYAPSREPARYMEWLRQQEPEVVFDPSQLKDTDDWVRAGALVFDAPIATAILETQPMYRDPEFFRVTQTPLTPDGIYPFQRYVIREKGTVEIAFQGCAQCHRRVLEDGRIIDGAQGNLPAGRRDAFQLRHSASSNEQRIRTDRASFAIPWVRPDPLADLERLTNEQIAARRERMPAGVITRQGTNPKWPAAVPDLTGIRERRFLDRTATARHRDIGDLMRYIAFTQGMDGRTRYNGWQPVSEITAPPNSSRARYSDEQLYALSLYLYSLRPPTNPNVFNEQAARGQQIFEHEHCGTCHTPPLYTNNQLVPADGHQVAAEDRLLFDVMRRPIGVDPNMTLETRRGTGYYTVPSLKGVWYRGPFGHSGSVMTLEDWLDPARLRDDYNPTGYPGLDPKPHAVRGHAFGLRLTPYEKAALIAFLKTL